MRPTWPWAACTGALATPRGKVLPIELLPPRDSAAAHRAFEWLAPGAHSLAIDDFGRYVAAACEGEIRIFDLDRLWAASAPFSGAAVALGAGWLSVLDYDGTVQRLELAGLSWG